MVSSSTMLFRGRADAGRQLATALDRFRQRSDVLVLALPRGGVPVAFEVAKELALSLDILNVRKLGVPGQEELAMGAVASGGVVYLNEDLVRELCIPQALITDAIKRAGAEIARREYFYRHNRPFPSLLGKTVIIVDDGIATGSTMLAAIMAARQLGCYQVVVAVPVAPASTCEELKTVADDVVCPYETFTAIGQWYEEFGQLDDTQVLAMLPIGEEAA